MISGSLPLFFVASKQGTNKRSIPEQKLLLVPVKPETPAGACGYYDS